MFVHDVEGVCCGVGEDEAVTGDEDDVCVVQVSTPEARSLRGPGWCPLVVADQREAWAAEGAEAARQAAGAFEPAGSWPGNGVPGL